MRIEPTLERDASPEHLPALIGFVGDVCRRAGVPDAVVRELRLAAEAACADVVARVGAASGPMAVKVMQVPGYVRLEITDRAALLDWPGVRTPGGSGAMAAAGEAPWARVARLVTEVHHERRVGGGNRFTLVKRYPAEA
jgi:anti-sigma regulatory factor (Ser/Thr protein kinase)